MCMLYKGLLALWLITDMAIFIATYALAYFLRVGFIFSSDFPFVPYIIIVALIAPVWLIFLLTTRTFALTRNQSSLRNLAYISYACVVGVSLFALIYYFVHGLFFSRLLLVYACIGSIIATRIWHQFFDYIKRALLRKPPATFPTLVIGANREAARLIKKLHETQSPLKPVAILDGRGSKEKDIEGVSVQGKLNKLEKTLEDESITHLIQCSDLEQSLNLLSACRKRKITYMLLPMVLGIVEGDERIDTLEGQPMTIVSPKGGPLAWFFK